MGRGGEGFGGVFENSGFSRKCFSGNLAFRFECRISVSLLARVADGAAQGHDAMDGFEQTAAVDLRLPKEPDGGDIELHGESTNRGLAPIAFAAEHFREVRLWDADFASKSADRHSALLDAMAHQVSRG
jgi:hypothetical protein